MKNMNRAIDQMKIQKNIEVPWNVSRILGIDKEIEIVGDQASFTTRTDFASLDEIRESISWLVHQFGGKVKWED
jgi:hypothetical protein